MTAPDPIYLLETLLALGIQLLLADNPELLLPPEVAILHPTPRLTRARAIVALLRETHFALERYRNAAPRMQTPESGSEGRDDDIPF